MMTVNCIRTARCFLGTMNSAAMADDGTLYKRFLAGEQAAYDQLMIRYGDSLTLYLYGYLHDWHAAEDQMIEAFARIMVKRPRIGEGHFKAYLYKTGPLCICAGILSAGIRNVDGVLLFFGWFDRESLLLV